MSRRAIPALLLVVLGFVGLVAVGRDTPEPTPAFFAVSGSTWMPAVGQSGNLTGSWFCPGLPTDGEDGAGGQVVVSNSAEVEMLGRYMVLTDAGVVADEAFSVEPYSQTRIDPTSFSDADFSGIVVEIEGGSGMVEQVARNALGDSVAACSNDTSASWYLADGFTVDDSVETLILTNPFDEPVVADLRFSTEERQSEPDRYRGFTVLPRSVRTIPVAELGARDEPVVSVAIEATAGRLVVGRAQEYSGGGRFGYDISLGAPELRDQWWFADGQVGEGIDEQYAIYNPTEDEVEVTVFFGGLPLEASTVNERDPIVVPPLRTVIFDPSDLSDSGGNTSADTADTTESSAPEESAEDDEFVDFAGPVTELPDGRHATAFSTLAQPSIVVDRVITREVGGSIATSVLMGAPPRPDGFVSNTWRLGIGPESATEDALVVYNIDQAEATVEVSSVGPDGPVVVPSLSEVALPSGGIIAIDLTDPEVLGRELIVSSTSRVFVERSLPRNHDLPGRSSSWPLPVSG
ncbi:DUF5719 family protein [Ilumatobacter nonamiensis]|uniref:DUF5719 family protein n=1 Tax=Ilumatobacter nonamiensis TaxID=467093 RepID=UPI00034755CC|nr:DUF5719 family protein [Ilumatobacter nonamiensis]